MKKNILSLKINSMTFTEAVRQIDSLIVTKKSSQVVTLNPEMVMAAQKDKEFRRIINQANLVVPDGKGIMLASKFLVRALGQRITGGDLTWAVCKLAEDRGYRVFFLGGETGIAKEASQRIKKLHPHLKIAGFYPGSPGDEKTIELLKQAKPDVLLVAFGAPKQEKFINGLKNQMISIPLSIGVGGTFDYIAGKYPYAPDWMRKIGLEWLYRLFTQPWRWKRIVTATIYFPWIVLISKIQK